MKIIIYVCYEVSFLPIVVASARLKLIAADRVPSLRELYQLPFYGKFFYTDQGKIYYLGTDNLDNQIYVMGTRNGFNIVSRAIKGLVEIFSHDSEQLLFQDLRSVRNNLISLGLFFYCNLGISFLGSFFLTWGIRRIYLKLMKFLEV